jgi:protein-S-isoprenylcysteine O-methyltransferase Ste14
MDSMAGTLTPVLKTIAFTIVAPGTVAGFLPWWIGGGLHSQGWGFQTCLGIILIAIGAGIYLRCAWEFAVRGLGTPAPIAPTKFLVTTALHRRVRNPMYIGVTLAIFGEAVLYRSPYVAAYGAAMLLAAHVFVISYEEPTLQRQFGEEYEKYSQTVPRWVPRLGRDGRL